MYCTCFSESRHGLCSEHCNGYAIDVGAMFLLYIFSDFDSRGYGFEGLRDVLG